MTRRDEGRGEGGMRGNAPEAKGPRVNTAREHLTPSQLTDRPPEALKRLGKHMNFFVIFQEV